MNRSLLSLLVLAICLMSARSVMGDERAHLRDAPLPDLKESIGDGAMGIISGASRVECFRIKQPPRFHAGQSGKNEPGELISVYPVVSRGKDRDRDFAARLARAILDRRSYTSQPRWGCFSPSIAFRFWKGRESADLLVCFRCGNVQVNTGTDEGHLITLDEERGTPAFITLAKEAFPGDAEIQKLTAEAVSPTVKHRVGSETAAILAHASRVEAFRIGSSHGQTKKGPTTLPSDGMAIYGIYRTGKTQGPEFASRFAANLLDDATYNQIVSACYEPGVAFRFWRDNEYVDVVVCFACHRLCIFRPGSDDETMLYIDRDKGVPALLKFVRDMFPDDPEIQKL